MARRGASSSMTFFSFQDIMSCITGIMILVTLILALDPMSDKPNTATASGLGDQLRETLARAKDRNAAASAAIAQATEALAAAREQPQITETQLAKMEKLLASEREGLKALERAREKAAGDAAVQEDRVTVLKSVIVQSEQKVRAIEADLADKAMSSRIRYQEGEQEKLRPLLFEVTPKGIAVGELDGKQIPRLSTTVSDAALNGLLVRWQQDPTAAGIAPDGHSIGALRSVLGNHAPGEWYGMIIIRQDTVVPSLGLRDLLRSEGYEVGWQLWDITAGGNATAGGFFDAPTLMESSKTKEKP